MPTQEELAMLGMNETEPNLEAEIGEAEQADEEQFASIAPRGDFSKKAMNNLVSAANRLLPAFEQTPDYPTFNEDVEVFPTDFVRVLSMFQGAVNAAAVNGAIDEQFDFEMEDITDDASLNFVAGKINNLAKSREFKNFLKNPPPEEEVEEEVIEKGTAAPTNEEMDTLFAGRL